MCGRTVDLDFPDEDVEERIGIDLCVCCRIKKCTYKMAEKPILTTGNGSVIPSLFIWYIL